MPQLSLYIDENTLNKIEMGAKIEHLSISKYVVRKLNESFSNAWPKNYNDLYGSINDETFKIDKINDFSNDCTRESL